VSRVRFLFDEDFNGRISVGFGAGCPKRTLEPSGKRALKVQRTRSFSSGPLPTINVVEDADLALALVQSVQAAGVLDERTLPRHRER